MRRLTFPNCEKNWTVDDARIVLEQWQQSGESIAAFARGHGVTASRLYSAKERLGRRSKPLELLPAVVDATASATTAAVAIRLRDGIAIEIADASPSWVAAMVREIERTQR